VKDNIVAANGQMNNFNGSIEKLVINAPKHNQALEKMFRLTSLQQGFQTLQSFTDKMRQFLGEGVEDSMDKGATMAALVQGTLINNHDLNTQLPAAGPEARKSLALVSKARRTKKRFASV